MSESKMSAEDSLCVNTIRCLSADMVQKANSGHPGMPMGMAPAAYALWTKVMKFSSANPSWINRDRFVLSNGHGCALLYSMLHLTGYQVTLDDLKNFRQLGSKTPGHPERTDTPGVEVTTGPLGQGISNAVGLAWAQSHLAARYNKPGFDVFDNYTYVFCGDGCLQEGVSCEASSLAGHWGLGRLIVIYDDNSISIDGDTALSFTEDVLKRYESYGWHTLRVENGDTDIDGLLGAIKEAQSVTDKPSIIAMKTVIGFGSGKEGTEGVHGSPLGDEDLAQVKKRFGLDPKQTFHIPREVSDVFQKAQKRGAASEAKWKELFTEYSNKHPTEAAEIKRRFDGTLPQNWDLKAPAWKPEDKAEGSRNYSAKVLNAFADAIPEIVGGSADLTGSNKTALKNATAFSKDNPSGRYIHFGVREHGMSAICNGIHAYGGFIPFGATFLNFIEYAYGAVRLSAISHHQVIYIMTHDSIGLGEDGPTHQPIEAWNLVRATPNLIDLKPADGNEVSGAYLVALQAKNSPSVISLSRQNLPNLSTSSAEKVALGAYSVVDDGKDTPDVILVSSGSEVAVAVDAAKKISGKKVRVVSMPSWHLFNKQSVEYRRQVLPVNVPIFSVEAAAITGWERFAHGSLGMTSFGSSAPYEDCYERFNLTAEKVAERVTAALENGQRWQRKWSPLSVHFDSI